MGLGAGWNEIEYTMYGLPFPAPAQRIRELDEACQMLKLLWTEELASFEGKYYTLSEARHEPKPVQKPYPPITIGGGGEQLTLRVVAKHADIYNVPMATPEVAEHKSAVLDGHCREIGRDPAEIRRSVQVFMQSADDVSGMADRIRPYLDLGISHVCVGMPLEYREGLVGRVAREVLGLL